MPNYQEWWSAWAPYWDQIENRHFSLRSIEQMLDGVVSPVLVVGAGQGLIVDFLQQKGHDVKGLDVDAEMVELARERRGLDMFLADAKDLPIDDNQYKTVILSSGVVDYQNDPEVIRQILTEAIRVTMPFGNIFMAFYQLSPVMESVYRNLGVIKSGVYHMNRIFELNDLIPKGPLACVKQIQQWTGGGFLPTMLYWARLGIALPKELKQENDLMSGIFRQAEAEGKDLSLLTKHAPRDVPYRKETEIYELLRSIDIAHHETLRSLDCLTLRHYKSSLTQSSQGQAPTKEQGESDWIIRTSNLSKSYAGAKKKAVDGVSLTVARGSIQGILGPNGAGKTTTLSMLCGLLSPDAGSVEFADGLRRRQMRRMLGFVPQDLALYPGLTGQENLQFFGRLYQITGKALAARIEELLAMVGLSDRAHDPVRRYSTGMMRRLNLAAGLIHDPQLLLLDEPTVGIDPQSRNCIYEAVLELKRAGVTVLYTTHYMEEATKLCDRIAIMDHGRIVFEGDPRQSVRDYGRLCIDFDAKQDVQPLQKHLIEQGLVLHAEIIDGGLSVYTGADTPALDVIHRITQIADEFDSPLSLRKITEPSLEGLFLDITGRRLRDRTDEA